MLMHHENDMSLNIGQYTIEQAEIDTFLLVAKNQNFTETANSLDTSAVQVMRRINKLESVFDRRLFNRSQSRLRLTKSAVGLFRQLSYLNELHDLINVPLEKNKRFNQRTVNILLFDCVAENILSKLVHLFASFPSYRLKLHIHHGTDQQNLLDYDILLIFEETILPTAHWFKQYAIFQRQQNLYASKEYLSQNSSKEHKKRVHIYGDCAEKEAARMGLCVISQSVMSGVLGNGLEVVSDAPTDKVSVVLYVVDSINPLPEVIQQSVELIMDKIKTLGFLIRE